MMVNYLAVYTESKNDSPGFSIWDTRQQALDAKVPKGMVLWDVIEIKDDATFGAEGVAYTGDYQTNDDYNPYKYVNQAPFGAEDRLETEPLNMKGAVVMFIAIVGILLWKA